MQCTWCGSYKSSIPMVCGTPYPMVCPDCGTQQQDIGYAEMRGMLYQRDRRIAKLEAQLADERLNREDLRLAISEINSVKAMHNGYDPEARAAIPGLKEPKSLRAAVENLIGEAQDLSNRERTQYIERIAELEAERDRLLAIASVILSMI